MRSVREALDRTPEKGSLTPTQAHPPHGGFREDPGRARATLPHLPALLVYVDVAVIVRE